MPTTYNRQGVFMGSRFDQVNQPTNKDFPALYHAHHQNFRADIPFWLGLARRQGSPVLELGCGTGRVLVPLAEAGYDVYGLDIDIEMLKFCRQQIPATIKSEAHLFQADLTFIPLKKLFSLAILPCNTFATLDNASRKSALSCINHQLSEGGLFAASMPNPAILSQLDPTEDTEIDMIFPHPITQNPVQVSYGIKRTEQNVIIEWFYDHLKPDGLVKRLPIRSQQKLISTEDTFTVFEQTGFKITAVYGDFDCSSYKNSSANLIIVAEKNTQD
jgi:SAM-dependent methyltransferase